MRRVWLSATLATVAFAGVVTGAAPGPAAPTPARERSAGAWALLPPAPSTDVSSFAASAWTGRELLFTSDPSRSAVAYNPTTKSWRTLPTGPPPTGAAQGGNFSVWTGREMLVSGYANAAYTPASDRWRRLPPPSTYAGMPAVVAWTGSQMIQWGGGCCGEFGESGSAYTPAINRWRALPASPLAGRRGTASTWTGKELVIAGGSAEVVKAGVVRDVFFADAAAYDPKTRSWRRLPSLPAPPRRGASAVWDGHDVLVVGGAAFLAQRYRPLADVFAYRPSTNRWRRLASLPQGRVGQAGVWTGKQLLIWGGQILRRGKLVPTRSGLSYDPVRDRWSSIGASPIAGPQPRAVWTGTSMIVWGDNPQGRAASYTPQR